MKTVNNMATIHAEAEQDLSRHRATLQNTPPRVDVYTAQETGAGSEPIRTEHEQH